MMIKAYSRSQRDAAATLNLIKMLKIQGSSPAVACQAWVRGQSGKCKHSSIVFAIFIAVEFTDFRAEVCNVFIHSQVLQAANAA